MDLLVCKANHNKLVIALASLLRISPFDISYSLNINFQSSFFVPYKISVAFFYNFYRSLCAYLWHRSHVTRVSTIAQHIPARYCAQMLRHRGKQQVTFLKVFVFIATCTANEVMALVLHNGSGDRTGFRES